MSITSDLTPTKTPDLPAERDAESTQAGAGPLWVVGMPHVGFCLVLGILFAFANFVSLRPTDLWCHVAYGQWIVQHAELPVEDPFLKLAAGVEVMDLAWLSQWMMYQVFERWGAEALSTMFALLTLGTFAVLGRVFYLQSQRIGLATLGMVLAVAVGWSRLWTVRPETFGAFCFALLLWILTARVRGQTHAVAGSAPGALLRGSWLLKLAVCLLFAVWANLHGSFVCGLAVLGCCFLGQAVRVGLRTRSARAVWKNRTLRQWLVICELAVFSCLLNPHGMRLLVSTLLFGGHENLQDVLEWQSLSLTGIGGVEFALSWVLLTIVFRFSRRRVRPAEVLLLAVFAAASATGLRMLSWYAPVVVFVLMPHLADIASRRWPRRAAQAGGEPVAVDPAGGLSQAARRSLMFGMGCCLVFWISFALSPSGVPVLGGQPRTEKQLYRQSPLGATEFLRAHPPQGQLWNPQHWGDWLLVHVPGDFSVFSTTMIHHLPPQVWRDYQKVYHAMPTWDNVLERYRVTTVLVDRQNQPQLAPTIRRSPNWRVVYEDDQSLVLTRIETEPPTQRDPSREEPAPGDSTQDEPGPDQP